MSSTSPFDRFMSLSPVRMFSEGVRPARVAAIAASLGAVMALSPAQSVHAAGIQPTASQAHSSSADFSSLPQAVFAIARPADGERFDDKVSNKGYVRSFIDAQRPGIFNDKSSGPVFRPDDQAAPISAFALSHNLRPSEAISAVRRAGAAKGTMASIDVHPDLVSKTASDSIENIARRLSRDLSGADGFSKENKADLTARLSDPFEQPAAVAVTGEMLAMKAVRDGDKKAASSAAAASLVGLTIAARMAEREEVAFERAQPLLFSRRADKGDQR